jgi:hypothetical protein
MESWLREVDVSSHYSMTRATRQRNSNIAHESHNGYKIMTAQYWQEASCQIGMSASLTWLIFRGYGCSGADELSETSRFRQ